MADHYDQLTDTEAAYWDIYTRLRALSDWDGFTDGQESHKDAARSWLINQRKFIWRCAEGKETPEYKAGWDINQRSERYAQLDENNLNAGSCRRTCQLPTNAGTPTEKSVISEREMWWRVSSVDNDTKKWRQDNADWLTSRRKQVWHLGEDEGWDEAERKTRYDNLCIATKTGQAYDDWATSHDTTTGEKKSSGGSSSRAQAVSRARSYLGVTESPANSNRGNPQPDGWEGRVYGSSGVPWCACFATCMAWDSGVKGSSSAAVQVIMSMAQNHQGMFRGWTTDPSEVLRGDLAVIGCATCHIGVVVDSDDALHTIEGNTSPGTEGSQFNGGCVAEKHRSRGEVIGWALVDYP
jgi:hypothetical protein